MMTTVLRSRLRSLALAGTCFGVAASPFLTAKAQQTSTPQPVILADFNHDGIPDVLVVSTTSPTATIAFGSVPYGTFATTSKAVTFPAACTSLPQGSVLTGDFNNDGLADIAFFCGATEGVMLGNGDGTFGAPKLLNAGSSQLAVLGDFNKDGKLDIAIIGAPGGNVTTQNIEFLAGNGDGTFAVAKVSPLPQAGYTAPIAADIDGDGYLDIVLGSFNTDGDTAPSVNVFGYNQGGTFGVSGQGVFNPSVSANVSISAASSVLAGNFFGTDANDLIVPDTGTTPGLFLIQNNSTSGNFSLGTPAKTAVAGLKAAMPGFFSGSGATDLIIANGTSISVMDNGGSGDFATDYTTLTIASTSTLFAVADANGDGYSDIYTAASTNGALRLAANITTGSATATAQPVTFGIGTEALSAAWNGDDNFLASTATGQVVVNGAITVASLTSSLNPSTFGNPVTFNVAIAPSLSTDSMPTGAIVLTDGAAMLASGTLTNGSYSYTTSTLSVGTHAIKAVYAGDNFFAASTSTILSQVVNHAPAVAPNLTWATPASIVYGIPLTAAQLNATAVDGTGAAIPGTFAYTPPAGTILDAGTKTLSVTFTPTDLLSFLPATQTVSLVVAQAAPVLTWATPANISSGTALSATQLNATAAGVNGAALPGVFTYTPPAGTVLSPGTQTLAVSFTPTNTVDYANATGSVKLVVSGVTVASFTPNAVPLNAPATTITLTGAGFISTSVVQVNGTPIPTNLVSATTLTAVVPATYFTKAGTLQITVANSGTSSVSSPLTLTVSAAVAATITAPPMTAPGSQATVTVTLTQPYPVDLVGTLTIGFTRVTTPQLTDPALQFAAGGTTLSFAIPANTTTVPAIQLQVGTIAGTITVPLSLTAAGVDVTPANLAPVTIVVPPAVPTVSGMTVTRSGDQLTVVIHGFSNTREVVNAKFHFTAAAGATLGTTDLTLPADTTFNTDWFDTNASDAYGSTFTYTQIFNTSDGAANIGSVDATLTNTIGASTTLTAQ